MNAATVITRMRRELQEWRTAGEGPELSWTCRGLEIGLKIVYQLAKEERIFRDSRMPRLARTAAADLYRAARLAYDDLNRGNRAKAVLALKQALDAVNEARSKR